MRETANDSSCFPTSLSLLFVLEQPGAQGQLIKRSNDLNPPKDPMIISAREVLFIENMRDDGNVGTAIRQFRSGALPIVTAPPITAAPTAAPTSPRPSPSPTR